MKALILCAGLGTRLRPITNKTPKAMVEVGGKPVLEHLVKHLENFGITEVVVNLHYLPDQIYKYFGTRLLYLYEPELLGASETVRRLRGWLAPHGGDFIVMNGDTLTNVNIKQMIKEHNTRPPRVMTVFREGEVNAGTWIINSDFFNYQHGDINTFNQHSYHEPGVYWQDMGTPEGLKKVRKHEEAQVRRVR
ncbi:MAG: NDP-sugar synthase [bacterium]|nr:NDP-sugar synthase [bacterium]